MPQLIQKEVQALLLDARGRIPAALMDDDIIEEAVLIRDRIGIGYALAYLEYKGMDMDGALERLYPVRH